MKNIFRSVIAFLLILNIGCNHSVKEIPLQIKFNSSAYIRLKLENVKNPFNFAYRYWYNLGINEINTPSFSVTSDTTIVLALYAHMPQKHELNIDGVNVPVFTALEDTVGVIFDCSNKHVDFDLKNKTINNYLLSVNNRSLKNRDEIRKLYHQYSMPYKELFSKLDSIGKVEESLLRNTNFNIPDWFKFLELQNIEFKIAHNKLSTASYRNFIKVNETDIPSSQDLSFLSNLDLSSPYNKYLDEFYNFMNFYAFYLIYGNNYVNSDSVTLLFNEEKLSTKMFDVFDHKGIDSDNLLAFKVDQTISDIRKNSARKKGRLTYLSKKYGEVHPYVAYLNEENSKISTYHLSKGDKAPEFYLSDLEGNYHNLQEETGKIVLLNFYVIGCKPCLKEIPYEKALLAKYGNASFQIINICVTSSEENFKKALDEFDFEGVNVFTQGNWNKILEKKYILSGFPHYTLIGKDGCIIMNNTYKPSNSKLTELIDLEIVKKS